MANGHWLFSATWALQTKREPRALKAVREEVVSGAHGRVLEVGVGVGTNFAYLADDAEYTGIDPDPHMLRRARAAAAKGGPKLDLQQVDVQHLPFEDSSFDAAISTATFCSVPDAVAGLKEVNRVLKPGGTFRFAEHVRSENRVYARVQSFLRPVTRTVGGGCEFNRDTIRAMREAGFTVEYRKTRMLGLPLVIGVATKT